MRTSHGCSRIWALDSASVPGEIDHAARRGHVRLELRDVDAARVPDRALEVAHAGDDGAVVPEHAGGDGADIAEALDDDRLAAQLLAQVLGRLVQDVDDPAPGGLAPPRRSAHDDRLAGDDAGHALALGHGVRVHHPRHRLLVGAEVGGGNVDVGADHQDDLGGVAAGQVLALPRRHAARQAAHAALGPAIGQAHQGALPAHEHGERGDLAEVDVAVVAQPALGRPERRRVMHAVADEDLGAPAVHHDRDAHDERAARIAQPLVDVRVELKARGDGVELGDGRPMQLGVELGGRDHGTVLIDRGAGGAAGARRATGPSRS